MILIDTGPIVALGDRKDPQHRRCVQALANLRGPLLTTIPVLTEALYFCWKNGGWAAQERLWTQLSIESLRIQFLDEQSLVRARELMADYNDHPMDFADASLVSIAEQTGIHRLFTIDEGFRAFRLKDNSFLEVFPSKGDGPRR